MLNSSKNYTNESLYLVFRIHLWPKDSFDPGFLTVIRIWILSLFPCELNESRFGPNISTLIFKYLFSKLCTWAYVYE